MNRLFQVRRYFALITAMPLAILPLPAATPDLPPAMPLVSAPTNMVPFLPPRGRPPVDFFRQLLAMSVKERNDFLTNKPPEFRARLLAKVREYQLLDPNERELRLCATEVRWYLFPIFRSPPEQHAGQLAQVPEHLRELVKARADEWDALTPGLQREFLENERTLHYFSHVDATNNPPPPQPDHGSYSNLWHADQERWNALSADKRRELTNRFNQFFELTDAEKEKSLNTLSDAERQQMEKTLQSFGKLPPQQRMECIRAFTKFAGMSPAERAQFLKNAERWSQLPPNERQAWRDLVTHVPLWPPVPNTLIMPPVPLQVMPHVHPHPTVATNLN